MICLKIKKRGRLIRPLAIVFSLTAKGETYVNSKRLCGVGIMFPATIFKITWNYFIFGIPHYGNIHVLGMELNST
jgi:hypothetical protein